jgi:hypothetical protein
MKSEKAVAPRKKPCRGCGDKKVLAAIARGEKQRLAADPEFARELEQRVGAVRTRIVHGFTVIERRG